MTEGIHKLVAVMDNPDARYTATVEGGRFILTGGSHADAYGPVDIPIHEAALLVTTIEMVCGLGSFRKNT